MRHQKRMSQKPHIFALALPQVMESEMRKQQHVSALETQAGTAPSYRECGHWPSLSFREKIE